MIPISVTRERFLVAIAQKVPLDAIEEAHFFKPIKQGGQESGVAVVAVHREEPTPDEAVAAGHVDVGTDGSSASDVDSAAAEETQIEMEVEPAMEESVDTRPTRYTVYTARFRHTLKGPERGKWELAVTEEADAPLLTVDAVVRGVSRRSGETDETIRLSGDEFRAALPEPART